MKKNHVLNVLKYFLNYLPKKKKYNTNQVRRFVEIIERLENAKEGAKWMIDTTQNPFLRLQWEKLYQYLDNFINKPICNDPELLEKELK